MISPSETAQKCLDGKGVSAPQKLGDFFKKMVSKNNDFSRKTLKLFKNIESPNMVSKRLYGHYLKSYEQIKKNRIWIAILSQKIGHLPPEAPNKRSSKPSEKQA